MTGNALVALVLELRGQVSSLQCRVSDLERGRHVHGLAVSERGGAPGPTPATTTPSVRLQGRRNLPSGIRVSAIAYGLYERGMSWGQVGHVLGYGHQTCPDSNARGMAKYHADKHGLPWPPQRPAVIA